MTATINASTSSGVVTSADTSGVLALQSNGTTKLTVDSTGAYGQIVSGTAVASTSGTSITFTGIPSWVKRITVMFQGVNTTSASQIQIQLGTGSGFEITGYVGSTSFGNTGATTFSSGFILAAGTSTTLLSGSTTISLLTGNTWAEQGILGWSNASAPNASGGYKSLSATLTQIRVTTVSGTDTFAAGSINILYEG
jgi:hypothetical protein